MRFALLQPWVDLAATFLPDRPAEAERILRAGLAHVAKAAARFLDRNYPTQVAA